MSSKTRARRRAVKEKAVLNPCTLSKCVDLAISRLQGRALSHQEHVTEIAIGLQRSFEHPEEPAATFLLVGERAVEKELIVERALCDLREKAWDSSTPVPRFAQVNFHGVLHAGGATAILRVIASALSSFLTDVGVEKDCGEPVQSTGRDCLTQCNEAVAKFKEEGFGIVFVVSDFHCFAPVGSSHSHLYQITNLLQDVNLRCGFVGTSAQQDVVDGLEKRLKSRFLPREISVSGFSCGDLDAVVSFLSEYLTLPEQRKRLTEVCDVESDTVDGIDSGAVCNFNQIIREILGSDGFRESLRRHLAGDCSESRLVLAVEDALRASVYSTYSTPGRSAGGFDCATNHFVKEFQLAVGLPFPSATMVLRDLSRVEATLLLSLKQLVDRWSSEREPIIFRDVFDEYRKLQPGLTGEYRRVQHGLLMGVNGGEEIPDVRVVEKAWSRLVEHSLVVQSNSGPTALRRVFLGVRARDVECAFENHGASDEEKSRARKQRKRARI